MTTNSNYFYLIAFILLVIFWGGKGHVKFITTLPGLGSKSWNSGQIGWHREVS